MFTETKIVVIGAGASGIAAASRLIQNDFKNVIILEAKNRIGGRIHTVDFADNIVDLGANWVHGEEDNIVFDMASKHNLIERNSYLPFNFFTSKGEHISKNESSQIMEIYEQIEKDSDILQTKFKPVGEIFTQRFYHLCQERKIASEDRLKQYLAWIYKLSSSIQGCDNLFEVSARRLLDYKTCPGDELINWKTNGYKAILHLFLENNLDNNNKYLNMNHIQLGRQVKCINYKHGNEILITTTDGIKYTASHVIFTPSLGVLKDQHLSLFEPKLPERKIRAIENLGIGTVNKVFLEFSDQWWPSDIYRICLLWSKEDEEEFISIYGENYKWLCHVYYFITLPHQPRVLCAWISGSLAKYPESLSDNDVKKQLFILLQRFVGKLYDISEPINIVRSRWYSDPCFRGSYSFRNMNTEINEIVGNDLAEPVLNDYEKPVLLFAGEATHDYYYSTVHGAIESGFREANRITNYYK